MSECVVRMEMPEACADCPFMEDHLDHVSCLVTGSHEGYRFKHLINKMENCPILCQLPEGHGRLVDADAIKLPKGFFEKVDNVPKFYEWLNSLPTIVPAEAESPSSKPNDGTVYDAVGQRIAAIATQFDENDSKLHIAEDGLPEQDGKYATRMSTDWLFW